MPRRSAGWPRRQEEREAALPTILDFLAARARSRRYLNISRVHIFMKFCGHHVNRVLSTLQGNILTLVLVILEVNIVIV